MEKSAIAGLSVAASVAGALIAADVVSAVAPDPAIDVVVNRDDGYVEVFMKMPAEAIVGVFDGDPSGFLDASGVVDFSLLRNGTWQRGDELFGTLTARDAAGAIDVEVMSAMFHPASVDLAFDTPLDAALAMSVCSVDQPDLRIPLDDLNVIVGFYSETVDSFGDLSLGFPETLRPAVDVAMRDFTATGDAVDTTVLLRDGAALALPALN
ncbi:MAG: hypothetical protein AAF684_06020 [Pseudomonadota bacterium]